MTLQKTTIVLPARRSPQLSDVEALRAQEQRHLVGDVDVIEIGEHEVRVAIESHIRQQQNARLAALAVQRLYEELRVTCCARRPSATRSGIGRLGILSPYTTWIGSFAGLANSAGVTGVPATCVPL